MSNINPEVIEGFTLSLLAPRYDQPRPIPDLHREMWAECCSDDLRVALAAPRGHAKSTAVTHAYGLSMLLFREADFCLLVSDTEAQAAEFLGDMKRELTDNENLRATFGVKKLLKDNETDFTCQMQDGHIFRVVAKGSGQKVRGLKWRNKRPNLILGDDLENDELVETPERREKFRRWFFSALLPCGADGCKVRIVGTILHLDALLMRLMENPEWRSKLWAAHGPDFTDILWPESFPEKRLRSIRAMYEAEGDIEGYFKEYLNSPVAEGATYFRKQDFLPMDTADYGSPKAYYATADFAISEKEKADYTVLMVGGVDPDGILHITDVRRFRGDADDIISELLSVQARWEPEIFTFETEKIDKAIGPSLNREMLRTGTFLNIEKVTPSKSKTTRARSIQKLMKAGVVRFDKEADWYPELEAELMTISAEGPKGKHDDMFDAFAYMGLTVDKYRESATQEEMDEDEYWREYTTHMSLGANAVTGY